MADFYYNGPGVSSAASPFNLAITFGSSAGWLRTGTRSGTLVTIPSGTSGVQIGWQGFANDGSTLGTVTAINANGTNLTTSASGTRTSQLMAFFPTTGTFPGSGDDIIFQNDWGRNLTFSWSATSPEVTCRNLTNNTSRAIQWSTATNTARINIYGNVSSPGGGVFLTNNSYPILVFKTGAVLNTTMTNYGSFIIDGDVTFNSAINNQAAPSYSSITHTSGTFTLNTDITVSSYNSNNTNTRTTNGTGNITILNTTLTGTAFNAANLQNYTWNSTGYIINNSSISRNVALGYTTSPVRGPNLRLQGTGSIAFTGLVLWLADFDYQAGTQWTGTGLVVNCCSWSYSSASNLAANTTVNFIGTGNWNNAGKIIPTVNINHSGTTTMQCDVAFDPTNNATTLNLLSGTLALNGRYIQMRTYTISGGSAKTINGSGTIYVNASNGTLTISNGNTVTRGATDYTISLAQTAAKTFAGGGGQYGTITQAGSGALTITGSNSLNDVTTSVLPTTINFQAGSTQTLTNFTLSGTSGSLATIQSNSTGTQFNLSRTVGTVSVNYLSIKDSNVAAAFFCNNTSVNVSNNTGWNFTTPAVIQAGFSGF